MSQEVKMGEPVRTKKLPPMLVQYLEYQERCPDCLVLFQVGDFYEAFFEDAVKIAETLNVTLTSRDKNSDNPIPMAGVPVGVIENYLMRLVENGHSVAVVSQCEGGTTGKGMVNRKLERIVTPGVQICGGGEDRGSVQVVAAVAIQPGVKKGDSNIEFGIAFSDIQSGEIVVREGSGLHSLADQLKRIGAKEVILPKSVGNEKIDRRSGWVRELERVLFDTQLKFRASPDGLVGIRDRDFQSYDGFLVLKPLVKRAVIQIVNYVDETTVEAVLPFTAVVFDRDEDAVQIDATTRRNLEIVQNFRDGGEVGTLFGAINHSVSPMGARLLRKWLLQPLQKKEEIDARLDGVQVLKECETSRVKIRSQLKFISDLERISARIELGIAGPRELSALRDGLRAVPEIAQSYSVCLDTGGSLVVQIAAVLGEKSESLPLLEETLAEEPPVHLKEGGVIRSGFSEELDRIREIKLNGKQWIAEMEASEREATGIPSLKVKFNNVHGFFIEVTKANLDKVPEHYVRRQSTTNAERFITDKLKELEQEVLSAEDKERALERELFVNLRTGLQPYTGEIRRLSKALAITDLLAGFAEYAVSEGLIRPEIEEGSTELVIEDGKHPVLLPMLREEFVPNSLSFAEKRNFGILTGPNMGGKSTYLRQTALLIIMAQIGSYVPASRCKIGLVDKIFARIGASDNILENESTFMVEMREAGYILAHATDRSLVLIDELGRGTATGDGLAIAQSVIEWMITQIKCRTLFATHFHELTRLEEVFADLIFNLSVVSVDLNGEVVFTHEIKPGPASRSYGLEVAKLAGLPTSLVKRADKILAELIEQEEGGERKIAGNHTGQLSIFDDLSSLSDEKNDEELNELRELEEQINQFAINHSSPLDALQFIADIQASISQKSK